MPQIPYRQNFNLTWRVDLPEHLICALYWKTARTCSRRSILTGLSVRFQSPPSPTHSVRRKGRPSRSLIAIDRELVVNSRGVSMVVTQQPAQPLATLYGFVTTSFRDLGNNRTSVGPAPRVLARLRGQSAAMSVGPSEQLGVDPITLDSHAIAESMRYEQEVRVMPLHDARNADMRCKSRR